MKASEKDIALLNAVYKERRAFHGEMHDHASTGGTSDGKRTLEHWKGALEALHMDFAAILDHRQVRHMYLPEWEDGLFIGGTEPGTNIVDSKAKVNTIHYNVDPNYLCGECYYCKSGIGHFCENMVGIGTTVHGGFAEYCTVPESQAYVFSKETSYVKAAMCEPVACCLHGIDMCDISCGDTVAVIGGGMIGLIMLQLAKLRGAAKLIMIEPVKEKRDMALALGADIAIDPRCTDVMEELSKCEVDRISTVIECVGKPVTMSQAVQIAGKKATVMLFGLTAPEETLSVKPFELFKKEITLKASFINPYTQQRALDLIESGKIDVETMICSISPVEELPEILSNAGLRAKGKYVITCQ